MTDTIITVTPPGETTVTVTGPTTTVRTNQPTVPNPRYYGQLVSTASQTNPVASAINLVTFTTLEEGEGVTLTNGNRINLANAGTYCLTLVVNVTKTDSGVDDAYFWLRKNAADVANSTMRQNMDGNNAHGTGHTGVDGNRHGRSISAGRLVEQRCRYEPHLCGGGHYTDQASHAECARAYLPDRRLVWYSRYRWHRASTLHPKGAK